MIHNGSITALFVLQRVSSEFETSKYGATQRPPALVPLAKRFIIRATFGVYKTNAIQFKFRSRLKVDQEGPGRMPPRKTAQEKKEEKEMKKKALALKVKEKAKAKAKVTKAKKPKTPAKLKIKIKKATTAKLPKSEVPADDSLNFSFTPDPNKNIDEAGPSDGVGEPSGNSLITKKLPARLDTSSVKDAGLVCRVERPDSPTEKVELEVDVSTVN